MVNYVEFLYGYLEGLDSMTWASQADMLDLAMNVTDTAWGVRRASTMKRDGFFHTMWKTYGRPMENHGKTMEDPLNTYGKPT